MSFPHAFSGNLCVQSVDSRLIRAGMTGGLNGYTTAYYVLCKFCSLRNTQYVAITNWVSYLRAIPLVPFTPIRIKLIKQVTSVQVVVILFAILKNCKW